MSEQAPQVHSASAPNVPERRARSTAFYRSSIGRKIIVAVTGAVLILFVIGHLLGNLQIFLGPEWINSYSQHLRDLGPFLWFVRIFLLISVILHIYFTMLFAIDNRRARPESYRQ